MGQGNELFAVMGQVNELFVQGHGSRQLIIYSGSWVKAIDSLFTVIGLETLAYSLS